MTEIKLHPDGYPVVRLEAGGEARWGGLTVPEHGSVTAFFFTEEEASPWPRLEVVE